MNSKTSINQDFLRELLISTVTTLRSQASTICEIGKSHSGGAVVHGDLEPIALAAVIEIGADKFRGTVALGFPEETFLEVYARMFGHRPERIDSENEDLSAELLKIIYRAARRILNESHGFNLEPTVPKVVRGGTDSADSSTNASSLVIPVWTDAGALRLEMSTEQARVP